MFRRVFALVMALFVGQSLYAQFSISGTIKDQQAQAPLSGASVRLSSVPNAAITRNALTDSTGRFTFQNLPSDSFQLSISFVGFKDVVRGIRLDSTSINLDSANAGTVAMEIALVPSSSNDLATVVISTRVAPATQKGDTLQINASQFKVNPDATAEDLAKKVPGITIENGQVKAQGENVQKVTIDGRELFGDDATAALRNLPAEVIDKIQIFDRLSDQAQLSGVDDGNTQKGINIVTKANMRNGQFGRVHNLSHLESIEIYTTGENVALSDVFIAIKNSSEAFPDVKDNKALKAYFEKVYPEMDFERVYSSDMKKMVNWSSALQKHNIDFTPAEQPAEETEAATEQPAAEATPVQEEGKKAPAKKSRKKNVAETLDEAGEKVVLDVNKDEVPEVAKTKTTKARKKKSEE